MSFQWNAGFKQPSFRPGQDDLIRCLECGTIDHVHIGDLVRAPSLVPDHCGQPMEVVPIDQLDAARSTSNRPKVCPRCTIAKPVTAFGIRNRAGRVERQSYCFDCSKQVQIERRAKARVAA